MKSNKTSIEKALDQVRHEAFFRSFIGLIFAAALGCAFFIQSDSMDILSIVIPCLIWLLFFSASFAKVFTFKSKCRKLLQALGADSYDEAELILERSQKLSDEIFLTSGELINLQTVNIFPLNAITSIRPFDVNRISHSDNGSRHIEYYGMHIITSDNRTESIRFGKSFIRNSVYKQLSEAAGLPLDYKYVS